MLSKLFFSIVLFISDSEYSLSGGKSSMLHYESFPYLENSFLV